MFNVFGFLTKKQNLERAGLHRALPEQPCGGLHTCMINGEEAGT
jgi:hypothetical protein